MRTRRSKRPVGRPVGRKPTGYAPKGTKPKTTVKADPKGYATDPRRGPRGRPIGRKQRPPVGPIVDPKREPYRPIKPIVRVKRPPVGPIVDPKRPPRPRTGPTPKPKTPRPKRPPTRRPSRRPTRGMDAIRRGMRGRRRGFQR